MQPIPPESLFRHRDFVRALAVRLVRDEGLADDVAQETWLAAVRRPPELESREKERAWLGRVSARFGLRALRTRRRRRLREERAARPEALPSAADEAERRAELRSVTESVLELAEPYRQAVLLQFYEGLSPNEIAERLGLPTQTVYSRVRRALALLREDLDRRHGGDRERWSHGLLALVAGRPGCGDPPPSASMPPAGVCGTTTGVLVMGTKLKVGALMSALGVGLFALWTFLPALEYGEPSAPDSVSDAAERVVAPEEDLVASASEEETQRNAVATEPEPRLDEPVASAALGSILVRATWADDGEPATQRGLMVFERNEPDPTDRERDVWTDARGELRLDNLQPGNFVFYGHLGGSFALDVKAGETTHFEYRVPTGLRIQGRIVDEQDRPVRGAQIWVSDRGNTIDGRVVASTGDDGSFDLLGISSLRHVGAFADGYVASRLRKINGAPGEEIELTITLARGGAVIAGSVLDQTGAPLVGAELTVYGPPEQPTYSEDGTLLTGRVVLTGRTGLDGSYRIVALPVGPAEIWVSASRCAPQKQELELVAGEVHDYSPQLLPGAVLVGRVTDANGKPVYQANVHAGEFLDYDFITAQTDEDGRYRIANLPPDIDVSIAKDEVGTAERSFQLAAGAELEWNAVLDAGLVVAGRVIDERGRPRHGWIVHVMGTVAQSSSGAVWSARVPTDSDGAFRVTGCPDQPVRVEVMPNPYDWDVILSRLLERPGGDLLELVVARDQLPNASASGRLLDANGEPTSAGVRAYLIGRTSFQRTDDTDSEGRFELERLVAGNYDLLIEPRNAPKFFVRGVEVPANEEVDLGVIELERTGLFSLFVRGTTEIAPFERFKISGESGYEQWYEAETHEDLALVPGRYEVALLGQDAALELRAFEITAGEVLHLDIDPRPGTSCRFELSAEQTAVYMRFELMDDNGERLTAWWEEYGASEIVATLCLAPGSYRLVARSDKGEEATIDFAVAAEELEHIERVRLE